MKRDVKKYFLDILEAAYDIRTFVSDMNFEAYQENRLVKAAVERKFEIIGEALNRIKKEDPGFLDQIRESPKIIAFRNIIIHGYDTVSDPIVWDVIQNKLSFLIEDVETLSNS